MATQMTQLQALTIAIAAVDTAISGQAIACDQADLRAAQAILAHMAAQKSKPRAKASGPTKAQLVNQGLARDVAVLVWDAPDPVTSVTVVKTMGDPQVGSTQKASYLLKLGAGQGWLTRLEVKGQVLWTRGDIDPRA